MSIQITQKKKKTWDTVNDMMGKSRSNLSSSMSFDEKSISNNQEIAESLNNYFCNVANSLAQNIEPTYVTYTSFIPEPVPFSFFLRPTTIPEITDVIQKLKTFHLDMMILILK